MKVPSKGLIIALAGALAVGTVLSPLASSLPDGLEWALGQLGVELGQDAAGGGFTAPMADYAIPGIRSAYFGKALAGLIGVLAVFGATYGVARALRRKTRTREAGP